MEFKGVKGQSPKPKVVFVLGATATGKSKLAISLAERFGGEVINSDKIQVYDGVPILTNKVTEEECAGVTHHLLGNLQPDADFTTEDFRREAAMAVARILSAGRLPVVAGGSNTYIEALVEGDGGAFRAAHDCLFLWLDAPPALLEWYTGVRVDEMVRRGLVDEARAAFDAGADYTRGVRRAIGLPEMHAYLRAERDGATGEAERAAMLERAVRDIKANTFGLLVAQVAKIRRLSTLEGWDVRRIDATAVFASMANGVCHKNTWEYVVWRPCQEMVKLFLGIPTTIDPAPPADVSGGATQPAPELADEVTSAVVVDAIDDVPGSFTADSTTLPAHEVVDEVAGTVVVDVINDVPGSFTAGAATLQPALEVADKVAGAVVVNSIHDVPGSSTAGSAGGAGGEGDDGGSGNAAGVSEAAPPAAAAPEASPSTV